MRNARQKGKLLLLTAALLAAVTAPCHAVSRPAAVPVASMQEFQERYAGDTGASAREYFAEAGLVCAGEVRLSGGAGRVDLVALGGIRVKTGALLEWNDPELAVMGPPPAITVERGGTLRVLRWDPRMTDGTMPTEGMIRIEEGGRLLLADGLTLPTGMVVKEHGSSDEIFPPPKPGPGEPDPPPDPEPIPAAPELSVTQWRHKAGRLTLWVQTEPIGLTAEQIGSIDLERGTDGTEWSLRQTLVHSDDLDGLASAAGGTPSNAWILDGKVKVQYVEETDGRPFYLRMTIHTKEGPVVSGPLFFEPPDSGANGGAVNSDERDEDGSSGNRGGVQGEFDREGQKVAPEPAPAARPTEETRPPEPGTGSDRTAGRSSADAGHGGRNARCQRDASARSRRPRAGRERRRSGAEVPSRGGGSARVGLRSAGIDRRRRRPRYAGRLRDRRGLPARRGRAAAAASQAPEKEALNGPTSSAERIEDPK